MWLKPRKIENNGVYETTNIRLLSPFISFYLPLSPFETPSICKDNKKNVYCKGTEAFVETFLRSSVGCGQMRR